MMRKNKLKEIDIKDRTYHHFDDIIGINNLDLKNFKVDKNGMKIFLLTAMDIKHQMR